MYSFGIGEDIEFDLAMIELGCTIYAFDPTPRAKTFIQSQQNPQIVFLPFGIHDRSGPTAFHLPADPQNVSCSVLRTRTTSPDSIIVEMRTFQQLVRMFGHHDIDIVKLDIEGSEYLVIDQILDSPTRIRQLAIETHNYVDSGRSTQLLVDRVESAGYTQRNHPPDITAHTSKFLFVKP